MALVDVMQGRGYERKREKERGLFTVTGRRGIQRRNADKSNC
jgi:hypothetical protein